MLKNNARRRIKTNPTTFNKLARAHDLAKKANENMVNTRLFRTNEKAFRSNPWHYAKSIYEEKSSTESLQCSNFETHTFFSYSFEQKDDYPGFPPRIEEALPLPSEEQEVPFDMSPITLGIIKTFLK